MPRIKDLREYIDALKQLGDLCTVEREVDPNLEIGAIIPRSYETGAPAPLFTNIKGTAPGYRIFGAPCALSSVPGMPLARIALSLGLEPTATAREIITTFADTHDRPAIPPKLVGSAPCKQNILLGDDASLDPFPTPLLHPGAGGPYVNSWGTIVVTTPDGKFTNWSIVRIMMIDGKHMTGLVFHPQHIAYVWQQWADQGKPCPYALVQGAQQTLPFIAGSPKPTTLSPPHRRDEDLEPAPRARRSRELSACATCALAVAYRRRAAAITRTCGQPMGYTGLRRCAVATRFAASEAPQNMLGTWGSLERQRRRQRQRQSLQPLDAIMTAGHYDCHLVAAETPLATASGTPAMSLALAACKAGPDAVALAGGITPYPGTQSSVAEVERLGATSLRYRVHRGSRTTPPSPPHHSPPGRAMSRPSRSMAERALYDAAVAYASRGWAAFPLFGTRDDVHGPLPRRSSARRR
jgi:hypothetical protein